MDIQEQIQNGVTECDLIAEIGDSEFVFEDEWGSSGRNAEGIWSDAPVVSRL